MTLDACGERSSGEVCEVGPAVVGSRTDADEAMVSTIRRLEKCARHCFRPAYIGTVAARLEYQSCLRTEAYVWRSVVQGWLVPPAVLQRGWCQRSVVSAH